MTGERHTLTPELPHRLAEAGPEVVVIGDAILDEWLHGECHRLCREAPAPVVDVKVHRNTAGGAANTARNLAALGARVRFVSVVGEDDAGSTVLDMLDTAGVDTSGVVRDAHRRTTTKQRVVAGEQVLVRIDEGEHRPLDDLTQRRVVDALLAAVVGCDAVLVCDYRAEVLGPVAHRALLDLRADLPLLLVDAHDLSRWAAAEPDIVTPSALEAEALLGTRLGENRAAAVDRHRAELRAATGARHVVVTLDRDGAVLLPGDQPSHRTWARPAPENRACGAGDTFMAALAVGASVGLPLQTAVELAQTAADVVVHEPGTTVCDTDRLADRLGRYRDCALPVEELVRRAEEHRAAGRRIVFTNGCFDVLHRGHVAYLNQAKDLGDVLVVAVNSDDSVRRLKGSDRPVNPAVDRAAVLAALSCVDHVTVFDDETPIRLLELVRPEVYAKGGDYTRDMLAETPVVEAAGGHVRILDYVPDHSTSGVIERIRAGT
ncbi:bifunctional heptose 7-phosphate kinase/heptose 1-phosphate adenyltransferase [Saccharothrix sp. ALI-22-I]|uniref:D-glycero-beta-D-manno-heptose 1-phosphate adenylyltransferase n=1 Tax=Saccharothrix sp. ALI-22-I TaxID=1933778 RepID=UPI00097C196F|nr:D-glycero-beta-D-manno-heptose 1-phosphate adenylyltransferase [Saccharothrix sp. ALI-22-I]ONI89669.1 bifunctional heptose 7-phosphate kinase/heptose 1-phosphate adenyltransferase [Saccharothrix sp. ALI-22-I]